MRKMLFIILIFITFIITGCSKTQEDDCLYTIKRIEENINWDNIDIISIDKILWTDDFGIRAFGQLCYDEENLYVHLRAVEENIRAEYTEPLSSVYQDSCLEFFFKLVDDNNLKLIQMDAYVYNLDHLRPIELVLQEVMTNHISLLTQKEQMMVGKYFIKSHLISLNYFIKIMNLKVNY